MGEDVYTANSNFDLMLRGKIILEKSKIIINYPYIRQN